MSRDAGRLAICWLLAHFLSGLAFAEEQQADGSQGTYFHKYEVTELPLWEAGIIAGGFTQPAYPGAEDKVSLVSGLPFVIYRGEYLRMDRGTVGVRAIHTPRTELDIGFAASLGSHADQVEARRGMADLGTLVEFGPRLKVNLGNVEQDKSWSRIQIPLRGVFDLNDHLAYRGMAGELQWVAEFGLPANWVVTGNLGLLYGDRMLAETWYRVTAAEATAGRPAYDARGGMMATRLSLLASHRYSNDMRFLGYLSVDSVSGSVNHDSPLVRQEVGWTIGLALAWTMSQSDSLAAE